MKEKVEKLVFRYNILLSLFAITFLSVGIAFVYAILYQCNGDEFDNILRTYSVGIGITGIFASLFFSIYLFFYKKKLMKGFL